MWRMPTLRWKSLEAYCRTILVASQLGQPVKTMTPTQLQDLLKIKQSLGIPDPRQRLERMLSCATTTNGGPA